MSKLQLFIFPILGIFFCLSVEVWASPVQSESIWQISTNHSLPADRSSQRCSFHKSPILGKKQSIVEEKIGENPFVHHIDLFRCTAPEGQTLGETFDGLLSTEGYPCELVNNLAENCQYYEWWSCPYPSPPIKSRYPPNVAHSIEQDEYLYMVTHYENPELLENVQVETGIEFTYYSEEKKYDAAFLQVGRYISYKNLIPPNAKKFLVPHKCTTECTKGLSDNINIFGITFHAHESAKEVKLQHIRNGSKISVIAHDVHYSPTEPFKFKKLDQEVKFLPGDELQVECTYDTTWADGKVMIGGNTLESEMCIAFVEYYPKTLKFSNCGTTLGASEIKKFFGIHEFDSEENVDPHVISPTKFKGLKFTDLVKQVDWTAEKMAEFQEIMVNGERDSYCSPNL